MPAERELEKQLKLVSKTGKYIVGRREVMSGLKGSKLLVWSTSANLPQSILDESKNLSVPAIRFSGNPVELGRACGIPFRVSVIAVKNTGDADLKPYSRSSDYSSSLQTPTTLPSEMTPEEEAPKKKSTTTRKKQPKESVEKKKVSARKPRKQTAESKESSKAAVEETMEAKTSKRSKKVKEADEDKEET